MGCSSSSTQTLAQENRPRVKAEDASGDSLVHHNGVAAEVSETISDQMQLPVQSAVLDEPSPGPGETEKPERITVLGSAAALEAVDPADVLPASSPEAEEHAASEPVDPTAAETTLDLEPASDLTPVRFTPVQEPKLPDSSSESALQETHAATQAAPVEPTAVQEPIPVELPLNVASTPAPEPTSVEPSPALESTSVEQNPDPEPSPALEPTSVEPCPALEPTSVEPCPALEPTSVEPSTALEPTSVEPSQALKPAPESTSVEQNPDPEPSPALEPTSVEPSPAPEPILNVDSTPPALPEPTSVEPSPVPELIPSEPILSAESAAAEDPTPSLEPAQVEPSPAVEPAPEEPSPGPATEAVAAEEHKICEGAAGEASLPDGSEVAAAGEALLQGSEVAVPGEALLQGSEVAAAVVGEDGADLIKSAEA